MIYHTIDIVTNMIVTIRYASWSIGMDGACGYSHGLCKGLYVIRFAPH